MTTGDNGSSPPRGNTGGPANEYIFWDDPRWPAANAARERREAEERAQRLAMLKATRIKFLVERNPLTEAIWIALLKPAHDVLAAPIKGWAPELTVQPGGDVLAEGTSSIVAMGEMIVARALRGDVAAFREVANRVQGAVRHAAEPDEEEGTEARQIQDRRRQLVEDVVRRLTHAAANASPNGSGARTEDPRSNGAAEPQSAE